MFWYYSMCHCVWIITEERSDRKQSGASFFKDNPAAIAGITAGGVVVLAVGGGKGYSTIETAIQR